MTAWFSLLFVFVLPAADLGQRLLGVPSVLVPVGDLAVVALGVLLPRSIGLRVGEARDARHVIAACAMLATAVYVLRVSAFHFSPFGENIYDLHYIASLVQAQQWPAPELWNPGAELRHYYYLGFYVVAFYTRLLGLNPGTGYLLFLVAVPVLVFANYWAAMRGTVPFRALAAFTATFPSTGLSLLVASGALPIGDHVRGMAHVRLPEWAELAEGKGWLERVASGDAYPVEGLAHLLGWLGDLHPPVFTFLLLAIVIGALSRSWAAQSTDPDPAAVLIGAAAVPLSFALNPWTLPCFALLGACVVLRERTLRGLLTGLIGAAGMLIVLMPLLLSLDLQTGSVSLAWLPAERRSSPLLFLVTWGPLLLVSLIMLFRHRRPTLLLPFIAMVIGLEVLLMDDPYGDRYERFNGVLKIGSLGLAGWTAAVLVIASRNAGRWLATLVLLPLLAVSLLQLVDALAPSWRVPSAERNWRLHPVGTLRREDHRWLYTALAAQCPGLTLEPRHGSAYADGPLVSTLLGWPTYSGWPSHLSQIGAMGEVERRRSDTMQAWFAEPSVELLRTWNIRYVLIDESLVWSRERVRALERVLHPHYRLVELGGDAGRVVGYFSAATACADGVSVSDSLRTTRSTR